MKTSTMIRLFGAVLISTGTGLAQSGPGGAEVHGDPFVPDGVLTVTPTVVQPGVQPDMIWSILYPRTVSDLAVLAPSGELVLNESTDVKVRVAGVAFDSDGTDLPVSLWIRVGGGSAPWQMIFYGTETEVRPDDYVYEVKNVADGTIIDLAARGRAPGGSWYNTRWTVANQVEVAAVTNGGSLTNECQSFSDGRLESFMTQFIDPNQDVILGPLDVMHVFELGSSDPASSQFDMQDIVVVTTIGRGNNGHGNNLDDVDVSNPGQGDGGPTGVDEGPDAIDDEGKIHKGRKN